MWVGGSLTAEAQHNTGRYELGGESNCRRRTCGKIRFLRRTFIFTAILFMNGQRKKVISLLEKVSRVCHRAG